MSCSGPRQLLLRDISASHWEILQALRSISFQVKIPFKQRRENHLGFEERVGEDKPKQWKVDHFSLCHLPPFFPGFWGNTPPLASGSGHMLFFITCTMGFKPQLPTFLLWTSFDGFCPQVTNFCLFMCVFMYHILVHKNPLLWLGWELQLPLRIKWFLLVGEIRAFCLFSSPPEGSRLTPISDGGWWVS